MGLACELEHKFCKDKGLGRLEVGDFSTLTVSGGIRLWKQGRKRWQAYNSCDLQLAAPERSLALACVTKQRALFSDLGLNCWAVDAQMPGRLGRYDLLGDFCGRRNFGALGRVWVELKVVGCRDFEEKLAKHREKLKPKLAQVAAADSSVEALLFVATKAEKNGKSWGRPRLTAELLLASGGNWQQLVGSSLHKKRKRGTVGEQKPSLTEVWASMTSAGGWAERPGAEGGGEKLGRLKHFLRAVGLPNGNPGKRARPWNKKLGRAGHDLPEQVQLETPGKKPWVGTKETFRYLHKWCV